jgi:hypothetical protein
MNIVTIAINRYLVHMPVWCVCFGLNKIAFLVVSAKLKNKFKSQKLNQKEHKKKKKLKK